MFPKRDTHSNNKLSIKVENKRGRSWGVARVWAARGGRRGARLAGACCTRMHPAQVLSPLTPRAAAPAIRQSRFDIRSSRLILQSHIKRRMRARLRNVKLRDFNIRSEIVCAVGYICIYICFCTIVLQFNGIFYKQINEYIEIIRTIWLSTKLGN